MKNKKVTIIGAGNVGATIAHILVVKKISDVVLVDILEGVPQGKALDIQESLPVEGSDYQVIGTNDYKDTEGSDIVVITAGLARKPGMSREDLIAKNSQIVKSVVGEIIKYSPETIIITVTNPLDAMVWVTSQASGLPKNKVMGMAGVLDTARFKTFIAEELKVQASKVEALVLGSHGDLMVPAISQTKVDGKPLKDLLPEERIEALIQRTRDGGAEIVNYLKTSGFYAPAASVVEMIVAISRDEKKILPVTAYMEGQYGIKDIYLGVPVVLGSGGVEEVKELDLEESELAGLKSCAEKVRELIDSLK